MARTVAQIQADITATQAALAKEQAQSAAAAAVLAAAQAAAAKEASDVTPVLSKLAALNVELAAAQRPPPSIDGATVIAGSGFLYNLAGQAFGINDHDQITFEGQVVPSSGSVVRLRYNKPLDQIEQTTSKGDIWTQPANLGPGKLLSKGTGAVNPPPVVVPPATVPPSPKSAPKGALGLKLLFDEDFSAGHNDFSAGFNDRWDPWFKEYGAGEDWRNPGGRCYDSLNQTWLCTDKRFDVEGPSTLVAVAGGGLDLRCFRNARKDARFFANGRYYGYTSGLLISKFQRNVGSYTEFVARLAKARGSFPSGWSKDFKDGEEIDNFEGQGIWWEKGVNRIFAGAFVPNVHGGSPDKWAHGNYNDFDFDPTADFHRYGTLWTNEGVRYFVDDVDQGLVPLPTMRNPQNLIINDNEGGWDGQEDHTQARDSWSSRWSRVQSYG